MTSKVPSDVFDEVVRDLLELDPELDVSGFAITGRVLRLARFLEALRGRELEEYGLTLGDFDVLATMRRRAHHGSMNIRDLQPSTMLSSGGTTKRLDRLENGGFLERFPDPDDRRGVLIRLTQAGRGLIDEVIPVILRMEADLVTNSLATERERSQIADVLRRLLLAQEDLESKGSDD